MKLNYNVLNLIRIAEARNYMSFKHLHCMRIDPRQGTATVTNGHILAEADIDTEDFPPVSVPATAINAAIAVLETFGVDEVVQVNAYLNLSKNQIECGGITIKYKPLSQSYPDATELFNCDFSDNSMLVDPEYLKLAIEILDDFGCCQKRFRRSPESAMIIIDDYKNKDIRILLKELFLLDREELK